MLSDRLFSQELGCSYFLDNRYIYGYKVNPSFQPNEGTFSYMGFLVNDVNASLNTNIGYSDFMFPYQGEMVNGFNENIPSSDFLERLPDVSKASFNFSQGLLSMGSRMESGFLSLDLNLKAYGDLVVPKSLIEVMKLGNKEGSYTINGLEFNAKSYIELSVNYALSLGKSFRMGVTAKGLLGLASGMFDVEKFDTGDLHVNPMMLIEFKDSIVDFIPGGYGVAASVGASWDTPLHGLSLDASLHNLGGMIQKTEAMGNYFDLLPITLNIGSKYSLPAYERLSCGIMGSFRFGKQFFYDTRAGVEITPVNVLGIALCAGINSYGPNFGAMMNLRLPMFSIFAGMDAVYTKFNSQMMPLNPVNTNLKFGVVLTIGNARAKRILNS